jgi:hypothetical protein
MFASSRRKTATFYVISRQVSEMPAVTPRSDKGKSSHSTSGKTGRRTFPKMEAFEIAFFMRMSGFASR